MWKDPKKESADFWTYLIVGVIVFLLTGTLLQWWTIPDGDWQKHWEHNGVIGD